MKNYFKHIMLILLLIPCSLIAQDHEGVPIEAPDNHVTNTDDYSKTLGCINKYCLADVNFDGLVNGADFSIWLGWNGTEVCPADMDKDGDVDGDDLIIFNAYYTGGATCNGCEADIDEDGDVDGDDLSILLGNFGIPCPCSPVDYNLDGYVDGADWSIFIGNYGVPCGKSLQDADTELSKALGCINKYCLADVNFDGLVNGADFSIWLGWNGTEVCPADMDKDGDVDGDDLIIFNAYYTGGATCNGCEADIDEDGDVDGDDLSILLGNFGIPCPCSPVDYNLDGYVDGADWSIFIGNYGVPCGKSLLNTDTDGTLDPATILELTELLNNAEYPVENEDEIVSILEAQKSLQLNANDLIEVSIFPVPANDIVNISTNSLSSIDLIIVDTQGRIVERVRMNSSIQIDVQHLAKGIYAIRDAEGKIVPKQFVVAR